MAQSKFTLYKYIKLADGSWRYCKAAFYSNGKIKPNRCIIGGKEEEHLEGSYYLYHKKSWMPVGADVLDAQRQRNARLDYDEFKRLQGTAPVQTPYVVPITPKRSLADAVEEWRNETEANRKRKKRIQQALRLQQFFERDDLSQGGKGRTRSPERRLAGEAGA
jgi:hypothetical protein